MDYTIKIGGEAGQGIQTIGEALGRVFVRLGWHVYTNQDYESRVRGGHNFYQLRVASFPIAAPRASVDLLVALDAASITMHGAELSARGVALYDAGALGVRQQDPRYIDIPMRRIAQDSGGAIMANTVATGAALGILGIELNALLNLLSEIFGAKGDAVVQANTAAARAGHQHAASACGGCSLRAEAAADAPRQQRLLMSGIEGIGIGALASRCGFYSAYPMTPSTGIMNYLAAKANNFGVVVEQAEDEIAAINMAIGASFAGVRAMTGTSGGGFCLMTEGLSLAGMTETPLVIAMGQRPGPATGFPTRTEQGELQFLVSAGHGEFPRIILAPGTPKQAVSLTFKAFDLAEKYQIPVFILFDAYLADTQWTVDGIDLNKLVPRDYRLRGDAFAGRQKYRRYAYTDTGVSPMAVPGDGPHLVVADSDEHNEHGHLVEDGATRLRMVAKRLLLKQPHIQREIAPPYYYGAPKPDTIIIGWGSTFGAMKEAVDLLSKKEEIGMLHFSEVYPLPRTAPFDYGALLRAARRTISIEQNATGQFHRLLRSETGIVIQEQILKYDGRPFLVEELAGEIDDRIRRT